MSQTRGERMAENLRVRQALQGLQEARGALELTGHQTLSKRLTAAILYLTERRNATDVNDNASHAERRSWTA